MKLKQHKGVYHLVDENGTIAASFGFNHLAITTELKVRMAESNPLEVDVNYTLKDGWIIKPK